MYEKLSTKQKVILDRTGKFVVRACPGSGKTYCVSAKLSRLISEWTLLYQGVATISFTNTAWQEIEKKCAEDFNTKISYPHFLGTIDSFINKFIFLPFGHLILKCEQRPVMVGEPYGVWGLGMNEQDALYYFDKVSYDINGDLYGKERKYFHGAFPPKFNQGGDENKNYLKLKQMKDALVKKGYATQSDANYFAMIILEKYPAVRKSLAIKFPWLIVDEAQDTTDIQMKIIELLIAENDNQNVMLVGDPDQAIFEWNNAKPELFTEKQVLWKDNSIILDESWRSSEKICNAIYNLSSLGENKILATNPAIKEFEFTPEIITYQEGQTKEIVKSFIEKCKDNGIEVTPKTTVVLARSKGFFIPGSFTTDIKPWLNSCPYARDFAIGKFLIDNKDYNRGIKYVEKGYIKFIKKIHYCSENDLDDFHDERGFVDFRKEIKAILDVLPLTNIKLGAWLKLSSEKLKSIEIPITFIYNVEANDLEFSSVFPQEYTDNIHREYRLSTIHKVKGETFEAVLLFLKKKVSKNYKTLLETSSVSQDEELRNVYVAISRPSKILVIAVPDEEDRSSWSNKLTPTS